jgi:thiosulfate dehydrogenase
MRGRIALAALVMSACAGKDSGQGFTSGGGSGGSGAGGTSGAGGGSGTEVKLCDDKTIVMLDTLPKDRAGGQAVSDALMAQWRAAHPDQEWETAVRRSWSVVPPADNRAVLAGEQGKEATYGRYTERDVLTWSRESERAALEGARVFHSGDELGSTIAVSCDMCHPDASNTHPETYPKYQVQLGRVALLRDMINWCLQHPVRAEPMAADDPRMRAMEAYILAQRKGVALEYGKH